MNILVDLKPGNDSPNSSNQSTQDYFSDSSDPYAACDERPKTTNSQQASTNHSLNQENGEPVCKTEATDSNISAEESSESLAHDNAEKSPADDKKKIKKERKSKKQRADKRKKKSERIQSVTEIQNSAGKTPGNCEDKKGLIDVKSNRQKKFETKEPEANRSLEDTKFYNIYLVDFW